MQNVNVFIQYSSYAYKRKQNPFKLKNVEEHCMIMLINNIDINYNSGDYETLASYEKYRSLFLYS